MSKNPNWNRDELILALDLYFRESGAIADSKHPSILELSQILNQLSDKTGEYKNSSFRNPNGVAMKLSNFTRFDPSYRGKGLERGGKLEKEVWDYFSVRRIELNNIASQLREYACNPSIKLNRKDYLDDEDEAQEGRILSRLHRYRERDSKITEKKKHHVLAKNGKLECEVCSFNFGKVYGELGIGFAECHHKIPISEYRINQKTKLSDLAILCSNCHRMIHRSKPWLTIHELQRRIVENKLG